MRIIGSFNDPLETQRFSEFLNQKGVVHEVEVESNKNWADTQYGDRIFRIWIIDEDQTNKAIEWFDHFKENPEDPTYPRASEVKTIISSITPPEGQKKTAGNAIPWDQQPMGFMNRAMIIICCALFVLSQFLTPAISEHTPSIAYAALLRSPVEKELMYDYPHKDEILDKIIRLYGVDKLQDPNDLPYEGQYLFSQYMKTPYWTGFYAFVMKNFPLPFKDWSIDAPLFEKIQQGEVWRLVTPIFLHADIFHLFFNMLWLLVLGKQLEQRIGPWKYLLFVIVAAIFSDTMQYLMSGSNFLGFSGVLCAMLTFIWMRQRRAAWEGYQLQKATIAFMMIFIFGMAGIQLVSFILELSMGTSISPGIANTAHLSGAAIGVLLGSLDYFSWNMKQNDFLKKSKE